MEIGCTSCSEVTLAPRPRPPTAAPAPPTSRSVRRTITSQPPAAITRTGAAARGPQAAFQPGMGTRWASRRQHSWSASASSHAGASCPAAHELGGGRCDEVQTARPVGTAVTRTERAQPTPPVGPRNVLAQEPLPDTRIPVGEGMFRTIGGDHHTSTAAMTTSTPHSSATRTIVRVQPTASTTHEGSNAATTSDPVPDCTGPGTPSGPDCGSTNRTPAFVSVRNVDAHAG
jgi:hypothetical protein